MAGEAAELVQRFNSMFRVGDRFRAVLHPEGSCQVHSAGPAMINDAGIAVVPIRYGRGTKFVLVESVSPKEGQPNHAHPALRA